MNIKKYKKNDLNFISLTNKNGFEVIFCDLGASIFAIKKNGVFLTQTPVDIELFKKMQIYQGKTIGRIANRVKDAQIRINNKIYKLDDNEPPKTLHGGKDGLSTKIFSYHVIDNTVIFHYYMKDLEDGLPGNLDLFVFYTLSDDKDDLLLEYSAVSSKDTILALTNHTFFTLGTPDLKKLSLKIKADRFIHPDKKSLLPIEEKVVDKIMDFNRTKKITRDINDGYLVNSATNGYDHHFCFSSINTNKPQITLSNNSMGLNIYTDYSGTQIYTDNYPDNNKWEQSSLSVRRSIAIEPQDSILNRTILKRNERYKRFILYSFFKK